MNGGSRPLADAETQRPCRGSDHFVGSGLLVTQGLAPREEAVFVAVNSLPDYLYVVIWPFMQYGVFLTTPVLTVVALAMRRLRLAITMAVAGLGVIFSPE